MIAVEEFKKMTVALWRTATSAQLDDAYKVYAEDLSDLPDHAVHFAMKRARRDLNEMPKPARLREWAKDAIPKATYRREVFGPCPHCDAMFAEASNPDGTAPRIYVDHEEHCPNPTLAKPEHKVFTGYTRDPKISTPFAVAKREVKQLHLAVSDSLEVPA